MAMEDGCCLASFIDGRSIESRRYFMARRTALEMLRDRGYSVQAEEIDRSLDQFRAIYGEQPDLDRLQISASLLSDSSRKVLVIFCGPGAFKLATIRGIISGIEKEVLSRLIIILEGKPTSQAREAIKANAPYKIEIFQISELLMNVTKHLAIPAHEVLTNEDKETLLNKYSIKDNQLPRMLASDAIARYYGLEPGQVVKVTHDEENIGFHVTYRCVV